LLPWQGADSARAAGGDGGTSGKQAHPDAAVCSGGRQREQIAQETSRGTWGGQMLGYMFL